MVEYDFGQGLYRAFVRTGYRNGNGQTESIDGNKFQFESISPIPIITNVETHGLGITVTWISDSSPDLMEIYDAATGDKLWEHNHCYSPYSPPSVPLEDGKSYYVTIESGNGYYSAPYYFTIDTSTYTFSTNPDIKINSKTLEVPNANLSQTEQAYGLTYDLYDNGLLVISGEMTSYRNDPYHDLGNIPHNTLYIYFAGSNVYYENLFGVSFYNVKEIAYYSKSYGTTGMSAADMFENCNRLLNIDFGENFSTYGVTDTSEMFMACSNLTTLDLSQAAMFSTSQTTTMNSMFKSCTRLTSINFGSFFATYSVTMTTEMFESCSNLTSLDVSGWRSLYKLQYADNMFDGCSSLISLNIETLTSIFTTSSGYYSMENMFRGCSSLTSLDVSKIKVHYVVDAGQAFKNCSSLTMLDFSSWRPTQPDIGSDGFIDGCIGLEELTVPAPRDTIILPKTMYNSSGTAYTSVPFTSSSSASQRFTLYAVNPNAPKMLMAKRGGEAVAVIDRDIIEYSFAPGLYRAFVRTGYKNAFNENGTIDGNKYEFGVLPSSGTWIPKTWYGLDSLFMFDGKYMWTDLSGRAFWSGQYEPMQYVLDNGSLWTRKQWNIQPQAKNIWNDGTNVYYSYGEYQYILDTSTDTWIQKENWPWISGINIWYDGTNYHHSSGWSSSDEYIYDKINDTWIQTQIYGPNDSGEHVDVTTWFNGSDIWYLKDNIYMSKGSRQWIYNKDTNEFDQIQWNGELYIDNLTAEYIWTDGTYAYYSNGNSQYVLEESTNTWISKTWGGLTYFEAENVWSHQNQVYYSLGEDNQWQLIP